MVWRAKAGPRPCQIAHLTAAALAGRLRVLSDPATKAAALALAAQMASEDGVASAIAHWDKWLPRQVMLCSASLLLDPPEHTVVRFRVSNWRGGYPVLLGSEAVAIMRNWALAGSLSTLRERLCLALLRVSDARTVRWGIARLSGLVSGMVAAIVGLVWEVLRSFCDWLIVPDACARRFGSIGCLLGFAFMPFFFVMRLLHAGLFFLDRIATGAYNGGVLWRHPTDGHMRTRDYMCDPSFSIGAHRSLNKLRLDAVQLELAEYAAAGVQRAAAMLDAIELALIAKHIYAPHTKGKNGHVATLEDVTRLAHLVGTNAKAKSSLDLSDEAAAALARDVELCGEFCSFSMFCVLLQRSRSTHGKHPPAPGKLVGESMRWRADRLRASLLAAVEGSIGDGVETALQTA